MELAKSKESHSSNPLTLKVGDRVAFSRKYLQSIACHTGTLCFVRGKVKLRFLLSGTSDEYMIEADWEDGVKRSFVNEKNLVREDRIPFES
jgi:hypothetical protein